jgi:iron complex outermembrane receptor protein
MVLASLVTMAATVVAAAEPLEVVVRRPDGSVLAGARVSVIGRPGSVVAASDGRCTIDPVPEVPFVLFIARPDGVALQPVSVEAVPPTGPLEVTVAAIGDTVTVVSGIVPDLEVPPAVASTVIGRADLDQRQPQRLTDVLENVPGAVRVGEGASVVPGLRGLPKHRTLILLDAGRVTAERRAGPSASFLDPDTVDEVEVIRGPGSVAYGSDAFGGIIRARSPMPSPDGQFGVRGRVFGGTVADERGAAGEVTFGGLGGGLLLGAQWSEADDYESPDGTVPDSAYETYGGRAAWQATLGSGVMQVGWRSDRARDVGKPVAAPGDRRTVYPVEDSDRLHIGYERPGPGDWTRLAASVSWDEYRLVLDRETPTAGGLLAVDRSDVGANDYGIRFEAERPVGVWRLVVGVDANGRYDLEALDQDILRGPSGETTDTFVAIDSARRDDLGLFLGLGRELGRWRFQGGVRGDRITTSNDGGYFGDRSTSNSDVSGFAAAGYRLTSELEVTGQVARGFRDPLLSDRYYRGPTGRGFVTGNPDLVPETSLQWDVALRWSRGGTRVEGFAYHYRIRDLIERYREDDDFFFRNRGEAELNGVEIEGAVDLGNGLEVRMGAWWLSGEVRDDGTPLDDVPSPGAAVTLAGAPSSRWWWSVRGAGYLRDDRPGPTEREVPGYVVLDAAVGVRLSDVVTAELSGRNLLDRSYPGSADADAATAPGRGVVLSIRARAR